MLISISVSDDLKLFHKISTVSKWSQL